MTNAKRGGHSRDLTYDIVRFIAITLVVLCHAAEGVYRTGDIPTSLGWGLSHYLGRLGVPLFFFLSGALILPKKFDTQGIRRFYSHNLLGLLITVEVWIVFYNIYFWRTGTETTIESWFEMATFSKAVPLGHWWYVPTILSMYLALPFVGLAIQNLDFKSLKIPLVFVVFFAFLVPTFNAFYAPRLNLEPYETTLQASYLGGAYLAYVVLGYYLFRKKLLGGVNQWALAFILLASSCFAVGLNRKGFDLWYDTIWILISSICLAELIRRASYAIGDELKTTLTGLSRFIETISIGAFGIYLVHYPVMVLVTPFIPVLSKNIVRCFCLFIATWGLSALIVVFLLALTSKAPKLRRAILDA